MLKLLKLAWKEIKLIKSQRISLALILIYPVLVVFTLAIAFSGSEFFGQYFGQSGLERVDIAIFLPEDSGQFDSSDFWEKISGYESVNLLRVRSPEKVREAIKMRIARVGIVVGEPSDENMQIDVDIFLDNSALLASKTIVGYAYVGLENVRYKKSQEILNSIWQDIEWIESRLYDESKKVDEFIESLREGKQRLLLLQEKINSIEISPMIEKIETFDQYYGETKTEIAESRQDLAGSKEDLEEYKAKLLTTKGKLIVYKQELGGIRNNVSNARAIAVEPVHSELVKIEQDLDEKIHEIDETIREIDEAIVKIDDSKRKIELADQRLVKADDRLDKSKETVGEFKEMLQLLQETIDETKGLINEAFESQELVEADLNNTKKLVASLIDTLEDFQKYDPGFLVNPLNVKEFNMYPVGDMALMSPVSLSLVLLLTTVLLAGVSVLRERRHGVNFRVRLSPTSKPMWIFGKILGQMLFAFFEASLIFCLIFFAFGVPLVGSPIDLFIVLVVVSFCFTTIGIFLTNFTRTESTLILSSLVLMIPMLFLSGIIFPLEFMPFAIRAFAEMLPLTIATNLFSSVMIKGTPIATELFPIGALLGLSLLLLVFSLIKREI